MRVVQIQLTTTPVIDQEWQCEKNMRCQKSSGKRPECRGISRIRDPSKREVASDALESFVFSWRDSTPLSFNRHSKAVYAAESERSARLSLPWISAVDGTPATSLGRKENPMGDVFFASLATDAVEWLLWKTKFSQTRTLFCTDDVDEIEYGRSEDIVHSASGITSTSSSLPISADTADEDSHFDGDVVGSNEDHFEWLANNFPAKTVTAKKDLYLDTGNPLRPGAWLNDSMLADSEGQVEEQRQSLVTLQPRRHYVVTSQVSIPMSRISLRPLSERQRGRCIFYRLLFPVASSSAPAVVSRSLSGLFPRLLTTEDIATRKPSFHPHHCAFMSLLDVASVVR